MMCDTCKVRPSARGSAFCESCGRWEVVSDCVGVAGMLLAIGALLLVCEVLR